MNMKRMTALALTVVTIAAGPAMAQQRGHMMAGEQMGQMSQGRTSDMPGGGMGMMGARTVPRKMGCDRDMGMMGAGRSAGMMNMMMGEGGMGMMGGRGSGMMSGMMGPGSCLSIKGGLGGMGMMGRYGMGPIMMLDLDEQQERELRKIRRELRKKNWDTMGAMLNEMDLLEEVEEAERPDPDAVAERYAAVCALKQQTVKEMVAARNQAYDLLSEEQREQLNEMRGGMTRSGGMNMMGSGGGMDMMMRGGGMGIMSE